jgi:DNA-binding NarL/FixJ family response regulator
METRLPSIVLLNAPGKGICEKKALMQGIKGVFYTDDRRDIILKGIESITNGESWFKRATLNAVLNDLMASSVQTTNVLPEINPSAMVDSVLTKREWMIVSLVAKGAQNQEIANQLHISVNTVKTHIYSIFRKTKCRNRVELITWSQMARMSA